MAKKEKFYQKIWVQITAVVTAVSSLIGIGYAIGTYKTDLDCKMEKMRLIEEYQAKIESQSDICKNATIIKMQKDINEIETYVEFIKMKKNEK